MRWVYLSIEKNEQKRIHTSQQGLAGDKSKGRRSEASSERNLLQGHQRGKERR